MSLYKAYIHFLKRIKNTVIENGENLPKYLKEIDKTINKCANKIHSTILKYSKFKDPWKTMEKKLSKNQYLQTIEAFYWNHFLTAQRFVLGAWRAKKKGDTLYMYKGPEI